MVTAVVIVIVLIVSAVAAYARSAYFLGVEGGDVVIYQGRPGGVLWLRRPKRASDVVVAPSQAEKWA